MFISQWIGKNLYSGNKLCGACKGVGFSLKSQTIKFLVCSADAHDRHDSDGRFCVSVSQIEKITDAVYLKRLRTVAPNNSALFLPDKPIYSETGAYHGLAIDLQIENFSAVAIISDRQKTYPVHQILASGDAFIIKKTSVFPLGRTLRREITVNNQSVAANAPVTKTLLQSAAKSGNLIRLTTALSPFCN